MLDISTATAKDSLKAEYLEPANGEKKSNGRSLHCESETDDQ